MVGAVDYRSRSLGSAMGLAALVFGVVPAVTVASTATGATAAGTLSALTVVGGQGVGAGANELAGPTQVALDGYGDVFVADGADRVVEYPLSSSTTAYATTGTIVEGLASRVDVTGIALDSAGDLFVTDGSNNRVLEFPVDRTARTPPVASRLGGPVARGPAPPSSTRLRTSPSIPAVISLSQTPATTGYRSTHGARRAPIRQAGLPSQALAGPGPGPASCQLQGHWRSTRTETSLWQTTAIIASRSSPSAVEHSQAPP